MKIIKKNKATLSGGRRPLFVLLWYTLTLISISVCLFFIIGEKTILTYASKVRPYAMPIFGEKYKNLFRLNEATLREQRLILFFGDSTVRMTDKRKGGKCVDRILGLELRNRYSDTGKIRVVRWAFNAARLFNFYCLTYRAEKYDPDIIVIPINLLLLDPEREVFQFNHTAGMIPITEQFNLEPGNPLKIEGISLADQITYKLDIYSLYAKGMKLRVMGKAGFGAPKTQQSGRLFEDAFAGTAVSGMKEEEDPPLFDLSSTLELDDELPDMLGYIAKSVEKRNIKVVFYITPLLPRFAHNGEAKSQGVDSYANKICTVATTETTTCLNLMNLLEPAYFIDNMHYDTDGHSKIAAALAPVVHSMLMADPDAE